MGTKGFWSELIHGTDGDGNKVTAKFGEGPNKGHTLLSDGHKSREEFTGKRGDRKHDHYNGKSGGTNRGKYTG